MTSIWRLLAASTVKTFAAHVYLQPPLSWLSWPDGRRRSCRSRRDRAADQDHAFVLADLENPQILHGHPLITHVARHAHVLPDAARRRTVADGAVPAMHHRTVGLRLAGHVVLLHDALEAFALGLADHIDESPDCELRHLEVDDAFELVPSGRRNSLTSFFGSTASLLEVAQERAW